MLQSNKISFKKERIFLRKIDNIAFLSDYFAIFAR
jgi:hypothetical protein